MLRVAASRFSTSFPKVKGGGRYFQAGAHLLNHTTPAHLSKDLFTRCISDSVKMHSPLRFCIKKTNEVVAACELNVIMKGFFFTAHKPSCGKVVFLHLSVSHSVHRGEGGMRAPTARTSPPPTLPPGNTRTPWWIPPNTVNERVVRILLECILVSKCIGVTSEISKAQKSPKHGLGSI